MTTLQKNDFTAIRNKLDSLRHRRENLEFMILECQVEGHTEQENVLEAELYSVETEIWIACCKLPDFDLLPF